MKNDKDNSVQVERLVSNFPILELRKASEPFAVITSNGELGEFNNKLCRQAAKEFDDAGDGPKEEYQCWAKLIVLILDGSAAQVDHIMKAGGGNQGDKIRSFSC